MLVEYYVNGRPTGIIEQSTTANDVRAEAWVKFFMRDFVKTSMSLESRPLVRTIDLK